MLNKKLKDELRQCQTKVANLESDLGAVTENRDWLLGEAARYRQLYAEKQREAQDLFTRLPNFIYGLAKHEATLACIKPHYASSGYSYVVSFKPRLHAPGNVHQPLDEEAYRNLLSNLMDSIGIKGWAWLEQTALAKSYGSDSVTNAPADMEKAEGELQTLLNQAVLVNKMKAAFETKEPAKKEKG